MLVRVEGPLPRGVSAKDVVLTVIGKIGIAAAPVAPSSTPAARCGRSRWKAA